MANAIKKILTLVLTFVLITCQLVAPVYATEGAPEEEGTLQVEVTVTPVENGETTVTTVTDTATGESSTTTQTQTTVTNDDGSTVETTTTESSSVNPAAGQSSSSSTEETITTSADKKQTDTEHEWTYTDTVTGSDTVNGEDTVTTDTDVTTTVTGEETSSVTVTQESPYVTKTEGQAQGQETTVVTDTTVTTTTETDEFLYEDTKVDETLTDTLPGSDTTTGEWVEGTPTDNAWITGAMAAGVGDALGDETSTTTKPTDVTPDAPGATLNLKPDGKNVTKTYTISLKDVSDGKYPKPQSTKDYTVTEIKENGKLVGWEVTHNTDATTDPNPVGAIDLTDDAQWTQVGYEQHVVRPEGYTVNPEGTTEGNVTTKVEEILDANGNFLGYKVTTITVEKTDNAANPVSTDSTRETVTVTGETTPSGFTLPAKPEESSETNDLGDTTTVTVTELMDGETVIGYTVVTTTTSKDGVVLYTETKNLYGTASTSKTDVVSDPTTDVTTTYTTVTTTDVQEIYATEAQRTMQLTQQQSLQYNTRLVTEQDTYQLVTGKDGNMYFLYEGVMYGVTGTNTIVNSYDVATGDTVPMTGYTDADDIRVRYDAVKNENGDTIIVTDYYTNQIFKDKYHDSGSANNKYRHIGYGLFSDFTLRDSWGNAHSAKQFMIQDGNQIRYVYCVELGAGISAGTYYTPTTYDKTDNHNVAPWSGATGTVQQLRSVALNGFWGTEHGIGSLENVKELMRRNGLTAEADRLTTGMAVAATQAAIWEFSSPSSHLHFNGDFLTYDDERGAAPTAADKAAITGLRSLLVELAKCDEGSGVADVITADTITAGSITVKDQVTDNKGNAKTDSQGNNLYNADLSFTMKVSTSSLHGDLVLEVKDSTGRSIGKYRLAGEDGKGIYLGITERIRPDANGTYTLTGLELAENVTINLNLHGVQHLDDGVYIYKGENNKQDFIGLSQKNNKVDLNIRMEFSVEEPTVQHTHTTTTQMRTDSQIATKVDTRIDTKSAVRTISSGKVETDKTHEIDVYGTVTTTVTEIDTTEEEREWESYWTEIDVRTPDPDPEDPTEEEKKDETKKTDEVIYIDAPKTGDNSAAWGVGSLISLIGIVLLNIRRRKNA